jgi:hypothetical protein
VALCKLSIKYFKKNAAGLKTTRQSLAGAKGLQWYLLTKIAILLSINFSTKNQINKMDKIQLNAHQIFAFFLPGIVFTIPSTYCYYYMNIEKGSIDSFFKHYKDNSILITFILLILSVLFGLFFDSIRNGLLEPIFERLNKKRKINWDYFFEESEEKIENLYSKYYNFYVFNINLILSLISSAIVLKLCIPIDCNLFDYLIIGSVCLIFGKEAYSLKREIIKITNLKKKS